MARSNYFCILSVSLIIGSCQHENTQVYPPEFKEYVDEFFYQASLRGQDLYPENFDFKIQFGKTADDVGGICNTLNNKITINAEDWEQRDSAVREHIIFHELGHCLLRRNHRNAESQSNECFSYMNGTEDDFECSLNYYSSYWREYYLNELFDATTTLPDWYLSNQDYSLHALNFTDSILIKDTTLAEYEEIEIENFRFNQMDTFLIQIEFNSLHPDEHHLSFQIGNLRFNHCNECSNGKTSLQIGNNKIYTSSIYENPNIKLTIVRNKDIISCYVNDYFVHAFEYAAVEGNYFRTMYFKYPAQLTIRYLYN